MCPTPFEFFKSYFHKEDMIKKNDEKKTTIENGKKLQ
jgi:hypothetical protein